MAINLNELEASGKRWEPPSEDFPMGKFIDGSAAGKRDGSYCKAAWANNIFGFFGALLRNAEMTPDGQVDTAQKSQLFDAMKKIFEGLISKIGIRYDQSQGLSEGEKTVARENIDAVSAATENETTEGIETKKAVTPASLKKMLDSTLVRTTAQTLTSMEMAQVRSNIDAVSDSALSAALKELIKENGGDIS